MPATLVLVHGAWHGSWCWERVVPLLERKALEVRTVDLPSVDPPGGSPGIADDAAAVTAALDAIPGEKVLCGHSYGGVVITHAAAGREDVTRLVYLAAVMPDSGESPAAAFARAGVAADWIVVEGDRMWPDPARAGRVFFNDCDAETQAAAVARLRPMSTAVQTQSVPVAAWRSLPSTFVICTLDRAIVPDAQRIFAKQAEDFVELESGHSPFLSQPAELAALLAQEAAS
jgi:pimeloyl-ACP methyl ester carboxylesterase